MSGPNKRLAWLAACAALTALPAAAQDPGTPRPMVANGQFVMQGGEAIYRDVCAACHMADARGAQGAGRYPALAADPRLASAAYAIRLVVHGQKGMPAFGPLLDDEQVAAVVTYVRSHFGNAYPGVVTAAQVKAAR